ncbi:MAG: hypothetical protein WC718_04540 [Phycisphaerales bacterium]
MNAEMLMLAAAPVGSLLVAAGGVVLGIMLVVYGLKGRAHRLKRSAAAETTVDDPRLRAMEARVSRLESIIERARGDIAELKEHRAPRTAAMPASKASAPSVLATAATQETLVPGATQAARGLNLVGADRSARQAGRTEAKPRNLTGEVPLDPDFAGIFEMADQGLSAAEIASKVQRPTGQVELILNLRRHGIGA